MYNVQNSVNYNSKSTLFLDYLKFVGKKFCFLFYNDLYELYIIICMTMFLTWKHYEIVQIYSLQHSLKVLKTIWNEINVLLLFLIIASEKQ